MAPSTLTALVRAYTEPHRHFHTLQHIQEMLVLGQKLGPLTERQVWAIWFHDFVEIPGQEGCQAESARHALAYLDATDVDRHAVKTIIMGTAGHFPGGLEAQLVSDLDLWILAAPAPRFAEYQRQIRAEYAAFSDDEFRRGRMDFLNDMLKRPLQNGTFYQTPHFRPFEQAALANIDAELAAWREPERMLAGLNPIVSSFGGDVLQPGR